MSIEFYKGTNINYENDGDVTLQPNKAIFKISLNGICEIELDHPYDKEGRWKILNGDGVIKAPTPYSDGQLFVIYNIKKNMLKTGLTIKARHIFFDLYYSTTEDIRAVECNCQRALDILLAGTKYTGHSNISKSATCYFVKQNRIESINGNKDNTILKRWGGEIFLDNYNVYINDKIGGDYGVEITYGTNMLDVGLTDDRQNIVTRIKPVAFNGRRLPELYIDSPLINKYRIVYEKYIEFGNLKYKGDLQNEASEEDDESIIFETEEELYLAMRKECEKLFEAGIDKPTVSGNVKVAALENTEKYKHIKGLVNIGLGDTVKAYNNDLDIDIITRCVGFEWDILKRKYINISIGEVVKNYFQNQTDVSNKVNNILNKNGDVKSESLTGIINATRTQFKAMRDIAQPQDVRAMLLEDRIKGSSTYGALTLGSMGLMIANERTLDDKDWNWNTFISGGYAMADWLIGNLKTVLIQNMDASFEIDLNKPGGALFRNNGKEAIKIANNTLTMYNWKNIGEDIGGLISLIREDDANKPIVSLWNDHDGAATISYKGEKDTDGVYSFPSYILFDKYNVLKNNYNQAIAFNESVTLLDNILALGREDEGQLYCSTAKDIVLKVKHGFGTVDKDSKNWTFFAGSDKAFFADWKTGNTYAYFGKNFFTLPGIWLSEGTSDIWTDKNLKVDKNFHVNGDLTCAGTKNRVVATEHFGKLKLNAVESPTAIFEDVGRGKLVNGKCIIKIDPKFLETINTDVPYEVQTWSYGPGVVWVDTTKMYKQYIVVEGTADIEFGYKIIAKQKNYENVRLEEVLKDTASFFVRKENTNGIR